jgi:uncharacterized repeat protein (TIGR03803 family)
MLAIAIDSGPWRADNPPMRHFGWFCWVVGAAFVPVGWAGSAPSVETLYSFQGPPNDGAVAGAVVMGPGGTIYGVTLEGGVVIGGVTLCVQGCGTVFELTPPAVTGGPWTETVLYKFTGASGDGAYPTGVILGRDGTLYGATEDGGTGCVPYGCGTVFRLSPPVEAGGSWTETILHAFRGPDGDGLEPFGPPVMGADGVLWGVTVEGGIDNNGTVYELAPGPDGAWVERILYSFTGQNGDGADPFGSLVIGAGGALFGTTSSGGTAAFADGYGTVFELMPPVSPGGQWTEKVLYSFAGLAGTYPVGDGFEPMGTLVIGPEGALYGTTVVGGMATSDCIVGCGTAFELTPPGSAGGAWTENLLHDFGVGRDGAFAYAGLAMGPGGVFYGTTTLDGGTVYELAPPASPGEPWRERVLCQAGSQAGVTLGKDGLIYGTFSAGAYGFGAVVRLTP